MSTVVESKTTLVALQGLRSANADINRSAERLATGQRINNAGDDPAGFGKAAVLKAEIGSFAQVKKNINQSINDLSKVGDALLNMSDYLVEMRSVALASASLSSSETGTLATYQETIAELVQGIKDIAKNTTFAGDAVIAGTGSSKTIQVGIDSGDTKSLSFTQLSAAGLGISSITLVAGSASNVATIDTAIDRVTKELAQVGGYQRSLESANELADSNILAKTGQYRDIMDADLAAEATNLAAARIRQDSATAVLAQANSMNRTIADYLCLMAPWRNCVQYRAPGV
jgi:flagellin